MRMDEPKNAIVNQPFNTILGTSIDDDIVEGFAAENGDTVAPNEDNVDRVNGLEGDDLIDTGLGNDILNGGRGDDNLFGGEGDDVLNLEDGDDYAEGGFGADIVNGGAGDDVIYGDNNGLNLLAETASATTFQELSQEGSWTFSDDLGQETISQSAATVAGETYKISFDLAANLSGGHSAAMVEVLWNGEVVETVQTNSGAYTTFEIDVVSTGEDGDLSFRAVEPVDAIEYDYSGEIVSFEKTMTIGGTDVEVSAFAPGQSKLYQVIEGQLHVFDTAANTCTAVGGAPSYKINAIGFNIEDDMIYGVAKSNGTDSLGNAVETTDIVMVDATGATYRVGEGFYGDYVGDFDDSGNLWTFHTSLDRISVVDVDNFDQDGNPRITYYDFPKGMFTDRTYDLAFDAETNSFYAVVAPKSQGGNGKVVQIDVSDVANGGQPSFSAVPVTGTLIDGEMENGMVKGAYGAVFFDGDGNLYYGLNAGDADMDTSTGNTGAIYRINADWDAGTAYSEFMSEAPSTSSNDGAVDPRSSDAFIEVDADAAVLLRDPSLSLVAGGDDTLRGGEGNDKLVGGSGADVLEGGAGDDHIWGGNWSADGSEDVFVFAAGSGKDFVHDFEADHDILDLSAFGTDVHSVKAASTDQGWATIIDLSELDGGLAGDKLILKSVGLDDLDQNNLIC